MAAKDKIKTVYVCSECGETSMRWLGRCPSCGAWNTMTEDVVVPTPPPSAKSPAAIAARAQASTLMAKNLRDISSTEEKSRILTGIKELDRVLGGGIVLGSVILLGGEPGVGKSTMLLQLCGAVAAPSIRFCILRARNPSARSSCVPIGWRSLKTISNWRQKVMWTKFAG